MANPDELLGPGEKPHIQSCLAYSYDGKPGVMLILKEDALVEVDGEPRPGVLMPPGAARELAYALLVQSQQVENGVLPPKASPIR